MPGEGVGAPVVGTAISEDLSPYASAVWIFDNSASAYVNNSVEAEIPSGTVFEWLGQSADYAYIGFTREFKGIIVDVTVVGSYGTLTWEYTDDASDNTSWKRFIPFVTYDFSLDKYMLFAPPRDWAKVSFSSTGPHNGETPPDTTARYWIRMSAASVTTAATISEIQLIPVVLYTIPENVNEFMQLKTDFSSSTIPTEAQVKRYIVEAEALIDRRTKRSWKWNRSGKFHPEEEYEYHDYNHYGVTLDHRDIIKIYDLSLWTGGTTWSSLTEGRENDFFVIKEEGMIYIARLFIPPIAFGLAARYFHWEYGEYKQAFRASYSFGADWRMSPDFGMVEETVNMIVASKIITSNDYSKMPTRGVDNVPFIEKIRTWEEKIEDNLESLSGFIIY